MPVIQAASSEARNATAAAMSAGSPDAAEWVEPGEPFERLRLVVPVRRPDGAGRHHVEPHALTAVPGREVLGQADLPGLRGRVLDVAERGHRVDRADGDHVAAVVQQVWQRRLDAPGGADQGEVELPVPLRRVGLLRRRADDTAAGVVYQHVEPSEPVDRGRDGGVEVRARGHVRLDGQGVVADSRREQVEFVLLDVGDDDRSALGGEAFRDGAADALGRRRDEGDPPLEAPHSAARQDPVDLLGRDPPGQSGAVEMAAQHDGPAAQEHSDEDADPRRTGEVHGGQESAPRSASPYRRGPRGCGRRTPVRRATAGPAGRTRPRGCRPRRRSRGCPGAGAHGTVRRAGAAR
jgi:hypothetical protein